MSNKTTNSVSNLAGAGHTEEQRTVRCVNVQGQWVRSQSGYGKRFSSTSVRLGDNGGENAKTTGHSLWEALDGAGGQKDLFERRGEGGGGGEAHLVGEEE